MPVQDQNFDKLAQKFAKNIYSTPKGEIRAAVLWRDLAKTVHNFEHRKLRILDAGGGYGFFSQKLAALGHQVVLCDISEQMLELAYEQVNSSKIPLNFTLLQSSIQDLDPNQIGTFDLILCHAVAEWLTEPKETLANLNKLLKPEAMLSLMFYNKEAMRFHALISGNFDYVEADLKVKKKVKLTPNNPLYIDEVRQWFNEWQLDIVCESGVRVIHDYLKKKQADPFSGQKLLQMELQYSQVEPYISIGRYVHFIGKNIG